MDEPIFRAPEPEDNDLPAATPSAAEREDSELPAEAYIDNAAALFNLPGGPDRPQNDGDPATRVAGGYAPYDPLRASGAEGDATPTPPWLTERNDAAVSPLNELSQPSEGAVPSVPDPELLPAEPEKDEKKRQKLYKKLALSLAAVAVVLLGVVILILYRNGWLPAWGNSSDVIYDQPQTVSEIADFYKTTVDNAKRDGAGYRKKAWQTISDMNLTGITLVDNIISGVFEEYFTPESSARTEKYAKETDEAKQHLPAFTLKDYSYIKSAECVAVGSTYQLTIVFQHEDTPGGSGSFLGKVTDTVFLWDTQIKPILAEISQLKDYENVHVDYTDVTITAEITNRGKIVSMTHTAPAEVSVGSARISIFTFSDKSFHFESVAQYRDFDY